MNVSIRIRLVCAAAALVTTWSLFSGVVSLADPTDPSAPMQLAVAGSSVR